MRKDIFKLVGVGAALVLVTLAAGAIGTAQKTITVCPSGCDFTSIQAAIQAAPEGATIQIKEGVYRENLRIAKRGLRLEGQGQVRLEAQDPTEPAVWLGREAKEVTLKGLAVVGGRRGIQLDGAAAVTLTNLSIADSQGDGLFVQDVFQLNVQDSELARHRESGAFISSRSSRILFESVRVVSNGRHGLEVSSSELELRGSLLRDNRGCGLWLDATAQLAGADNAARDNGQGDLCAPSGFRVPEGFWEKVPPGPPLNLRVSPADWTRGPITIDWENPEDPSGIAAFWYKIGAEPRSAEDGTRRPIAQKPLVLENPPPGEQPVYLWLEDGVGNKSHQNAARATYRLAFSTLTGHTSGVWSVAFSPDGRLLASGSFDTTIKLWEVATGREVRTLRGHTGSVWSVAFSPDGRLLASGSSDNTIKLWEVATGREVRTLTGHTDYVWSVAFSPDGRLLASGSSDNTIKLWEVASGSVVRTLTGHTDYVNSVAFSPDGRLLASASWDKTIKLWDLRAILGR